MLMRVLVTGATGFVGREVCRQLGAAGHGIRILARDPERAVGGPSKPGKGPSPPFSPGEIRGGNLLDPASLAGVADGCDAVIHLVGIISEIGEQTFENVHTRATRNVLAEARRAGVRRWIQMSALGTRPAAVSRYHQTKWAAEEAVRASGLEWTILRPSLIYGPEDHFVNLFARMARWSPVLPVMGSGNNLLQPVAVENVARAFVAALTEPRSVGQTLDVCGAERLTFLAVLDAILAALGRRRFKLRIPWPVARVQAALLERLFPLVLRQAPPLNRDQLLMLQEDNVGDGTRADEWFGLRHASFAADIRRYVGRPEVVGRGD
ncbi:MAG: complex I NDUFA9 subunit family protein [Limisphaerales bacterium]